jgi:thiol:disulfide interchange protein DsbD
MKHLLFILLLVFGSKAMAQERVKWDFSCDTKSKQLIFNAKISDGWHLYSQHINNTIGPVPTSFTFESHPNVVFDGGVIEPKPIQAYDENFEATLDFFKTEVNFTQKLSSFKSGETIQGYVTFMVCNEVMCLPPSDYPFTIQIP